MARLEPVPLSAVPADSDEHKQLEPIYQKARQDFDLDAVPTLLRCLGHKPQSLEGLWTFIEKTFLAEGGAIHRTTKDLIALAASSSAQAPHISQMIRKGLQGRGVSEAILQDLQTKGETMQLPENTRRVLLFGRRACLDPALLEASDFEDLRKDGLSEADLAELITFAGLISALITIHRALGLDHEPDKEAGTKGKKKASEAS